MFIGFILTLLACLFWGLTFVIPAFLAGFSSIEIALGRYLIYGILSLILFGCCCFKKLINYPRSFWLTALLFSLVGNIIYYGSLVLGVQYANPSITTLIVGIAPVTTAFYGNWKERECDFSRLIVPSLIITAGLIIINAESLWMNDDNPFNTNYLFGLFCAFLTLFSFTWYTISNARFLKSNPAISFFEWATMMGLMTLLLVFIIALLITPFIGYSHIEKYTIWSEEIQTFLLLVSVLGIFCSWLSTYFWSSGSVLLPVSMGGQMSIFKTIFGLLFVYIFEKRLPSVLEIIGICMIFFAIYYTMKIFINKKSLVSSQ